MFVVDLEGATHGSALAMLGCMQLPLALLLVPSLHRLRSNGYS
jgi:hypothetical protein